MDIGEVIQNNADAFSGIENAGEVIKQVGTIAKGLGFEVFANNSKTPEYISKTNYDSVVSERDTFKTQTSDLNKQLETFKKAAGDNGELTKQIEDFQIKLADAENQNIGIRIDTAIKLAAIGLKAKDVGDILAFVDKSKLKLNNDGTVTGLEEQMNDLKEKKAYLFNDEDANKDDEGGEEGKGTGHIGKGNRNKEKAKEGGFGERLAKSRTESQVVDRNSFFK